MSEAQAKPPLIGPAICAVMGDLAKEGVGKNAKNTQQDFKYRSIDDVMDALAQTMPKHGVFIVPHTKARVVEVRQSRSGGTLFHVVVEMEYDFTCANDDSAKRVGPIFGEAMDSGDKATNKAMSIAYKYACTQTFNIAFTGDDPDADTHQVAGAQEEGTASSPPAAPKPAAGPPAAPAPAPRREVPVSHDGKPRVLRPGGLFGYGKKFNETPWSVMLSRDLEWFRNADRTPTSVRAQIDAELAWRDYETSQLDAAKERHRAELEKPFETDIP